ncbi:MAG: RHS repeat-associated core domain-containing protein, partial [Burkholderiales bacterium]
YGSRSNVPDSMVMGGVTYRLVADHLGSVRLVVDAANGDVIQRIEYDVWGVATLDTNPGFQPFGFAGGLYDAAAELVHFGARDYDPQVGVWISKDPARFAGGFNFYEYSNSDPVNYADDSGHQPRAVARLVELIVNKALIFGARVSEEEAVIVAREGMDLIAHSKAAARRIAKKASGEFCPLSHPKHPASGPSGRPHYHVYTPSGEKGKAHIFYTPAPVAPTFGDDLADFADLFSPMLFFFVNPDEVQGA